MRRGPRMLLLLGIAAVSAWRCAPPTDGGAAEAPGASITDPAGVALQLEAELAGPEARDHGAPLRERAELARFYAARGWRPAWAALGRRGEDALLRAVRAADDHGLSPERYHVERLAQVVSSDAPLDTRTAAQRDLLLSDSFLHLGRHLSAGAVDPHRIQPRYERGEPPPDVVAALDEALRRGEVASALAALEPPHREYAALRAGLTRMRAAASGPAPSQAVAERLDQLRANLERWRWQPRDFGARSVRVNVAEFGLRAWDADTSSLAMRVVVGCTGWKTPMLHAAVTHLVLNPAWDVPRSIAVREMLPSARRKPDYFASKGLQVWETGAGNERRLVDSTAVDWNSVDARSFDFHVRQPPGPRNPLGRIKFIFPNVYGVYLHGTPGRSALERDLRALSHGCVRVEDEVALAVWMLSPDPRWSREGLLAALETAREERVSLPEPLPVHLLYFTAEAGPDGTLVFHGDPYGWDARVAAALRELALPGSVAQPVDSADAEALAALIAGSLDRVDRGARRLRS